MLNARDELEGEVVAVELQSADAVVEFHEVGDEGEQRVVELVVGEV